jgi:hypothetical protein
MEGTSRNSTNYSIDLNFLPVEGEIPNCVLYRRLRISPQEERPMPYAMLHKLPLSPSDLKGEWAHFWVLAEELAGFESFEFQAALRLDITRGLLFRALTQSLLASKDSTTYILPRSPFVQEVSLVIATHSEGAELLVVQPYFLRALRRVGFLVDFHFKLAPEGTFSRRVQQLSLSLDRNFRRNADYYSDRTKKIRQALEANWSIFRHLTLPGCASPLRISQRFAKLRADRLQTKVYVFSGGRESKSQLSGLRDLGPLTTLQTTPRLLFAFREQDRSAARMLAVGLRGQKRVGQFTFPGFNALFRSDLQIDSNPIILPDFSEPTMERALTRVQAEQSSSTLLLPVIVLPEGEENGYFLQKAIFSHSGLPTQVCTLKVLKDEEALKWAVANIALQIFCKAGGQPWKVRPTAEGTLIIGISQSHKVKIVDDTPHIERYFAFSVLTDSSGLFQEIKVLGDASNDSAYMSALQANLLDILKAESELFRRVVVHTSFKLKYHEMDAIQATVRQAAEAAGGRCKFAVLKVNQRSRFFGINSAANSLVPYEGTRVELGHHEFLLWFEGILPDKPNVTKAFAGPTHVQFLRVSDDATDAAEERELLQDLINLSGANWRGFNAKSSPVSIFYCQLVADFVQHFHERGLPMPSVQDLRPWFL